VGVLVASVREQAQDARDLTVEAALVAAHVQDGRLRNGVVEPLERCLEVLLAGVWCQRHARLRFRAAWYRDCRLRASPLVGREAGSPTPGRIRVRAPPGPAAPRPSRCQPAR